MHLPKIGLRQAIFSSSLAAILGLVVLPWLYDTFGEAPKLVKSKIRASEALNLLCGSDLQLFIVPWRLSISDSDANGEAALSYWVFCKGHLSRADSLLTHQGGEWKIDSLQLLGPSGALNVVP